MEDFFRDTLKKILGDISKKKILKDKIMESWLKINKDYTQHATPAFLNKGILYIDVEDSNWLYYCSLKKEEIKKDLEPLFLEKQLKEIKFRVRK